MAKQTIKASDEKCETLETSDKRCNTLEASDEKCKMLEVSDEKCETLVKSKMLLLLRVEQIFFHRFGSGAEGLSFYHPGAKTVKPD